MDPSNSSNKNNYYHSNYISPFNNIEVLLLLLVLGFIVFKIMNPQVSSKPCIQLDLTSTPSF